ncbi:hypothetical protein J2S43_007533 [Catenuloplanes nepalensis]|uniref:Uncharacterized protein n=1 Tax=Catenuloplanes nepalensis TaxID=587533 RepID=A0ABT9N6F5_9ACTN|nr:hypothetical protein [Catenuloplanes nepalensis]MDP9799021.1 hypothetical protein [Catenuloplanes nepalensis]
MAYDVLQPSQWRVIDFLFRNLNQRVSPSLKRLMKDQDVERPEIVDLVDRGLVEARFGGEPCVLIGPVKRAPEHQVRIKLSRAGFHRAHRDPLHLVLAPLGGGATGMEMSLRELTTWPRDGVTVPDLLTIHAAGLIEVRTGAGSVIDPELLERAVRTYTCCPGCGEIAIKKRPANSNWLQTWTAAGNEPPDWSHVDGEPLCTEMGDGGYRPGEGTQVPPASWLSLPGARITTRGRTYISNKL